MQQAQKSISRVGILSIVIYVIAVVFILRLFYLQVIRHDYYESEAVKEHIAKFTIPAKRGNIYALDGSDGKLAPLVLNEPAYTVFADPRYVTDESKVVEALRRIAGGNTVSGFEESLKDKNRQYAVLARQINKRQADLVKEADLQGVGLQEHEKRVYPEDGLAAQVLGFVNSEGQGQYGVEGALQEVLAGKVGTLKAVTDVHGIPISVGNDNIQEPAKNGDDIVLSIDRNLQFYVESALRNGLKKAKATKGSVVVMNPNNGQVMAMANMPTYEPAKYQEVKDYSRFSNMAISSPYEPGSVVKALTMGVGLNEGVITPGTTYNNTGSTKVEDRVIKNVLNTVLGNVNMTQVLVYSYNTGAVEVLRRLGDGDINFKGRNTLYDYFVNRYQFNKPTGIELAGEAAGTIIKAGEANSSDGGSVRYANMTFGQGMLVTPLQMAAAFSSAVNGGTYYKPQIVAGTNQDGKLVEKSSEIVRSNVLSASASANLRRMLRDARADFLGASDKRGYLIGGKTGTAEVFDPQTGKYSETQNIGSYIGFGGKNKPEYVIIVRVDDSRIGGFAGSMAAAPIFTDISNWILDYKKIQPN